MINYKISVPLYWIILPLFLFFSLVMSVVYFWIDGDSLPKWSALIGSLAGAFIVASMQLLVSVFDALKFAKMTSTGFIEILPGRKDVGYYKKIIADSKKKIRVIGVTASRFMDDFARIESNEGETPVLVDALTRGVNVQILLPNRNNLTPKQVNDLENITLPIYQQLRSIHGNRIEIRFYNHIPLHSIVTTDSIAIVGPMFFHKDSKNTQSIVLRSDSMYADQYAQHFDAEWNSSSEEI